MTAVPATDEQRRIQPFVTDTVRPVYCLRNLPEEVVAVLFAYYSRSRDSLRQNLFKLIQEGDLNLQPVADAEDEDFLVEARDKARAFHEKWVVGYGHSSVAEHAMVHVAVEDVSILASKVIEDARLVSFTEKSTRYVRFDTSRFHTPGHLPEPAAAAYAAGVRALMETYDDLMPGLVEHFQKVVPIREGQSERGHRNACRAQACDVLRYLLPAATYTNIGMTVNGRALEALLVKMLSHPLPEVQDYGRMIKEESIKIVPTLIKYAEPSQYRTGTESAVARIADEIVNASPESVDVDANSVRLVRHDEDAEERVIEAILFAASNGSASATRSRVAGMDAEARKRVLGEYLARRGRHDAPLRALEETSYTFEIVVDYGAYRDIQRHRMAGQYPQRLTVDLGYERPAALQEAGMGGAFDAAMDRAAIAFRALRDGFPEEAQYVVPLAYRKRLLMSMNLREVHHFVQLRSARQGHTSYRRLAQEVYREVARVHPGLASQIRVDLADYDLSRG